MYIPKPFVETDQEKLYTFIENNGFAILFSQGEGSPWASHLPLLLERGPGENGVLIGHFARANPHWQLAAEASEVLVIFSGPHTYISPTWYQKPNTVPTWNYLAVHVYGQLSLVQDPHRLKEILHKTVDYYEADFPTPWQIDMPPDLLEAMMAGIVGFEIKISRIEGKRKLNQNHPNERRRRVIDALRQYPDENSQAIAAEMALDLNRS